MRSRRNGERMLVKTLLCWAESVTCDGLIDGIEDFAQSGDVLLKGQRSPPPGLGVTRSAAAPHIAKPSTRLKCYIRQVPKMERKPGAFLKRKRSRGPSCAFSFWG